MKFEESTLFESVNFVLSSVSRTIHCGTAGSPGSSFVESSRNSSITRPMSSHEGCGRRLFGQEKQRVRQTQTPNPRERTLLDSQRPKIPRKGIVSTTEPNPLSVANSLSELSLPSVGHLKSNSSTLETLPRSDTCQSKSTVNANAVLREM